MDGPTLCASCGGAHGPGGPCVPPAKQVVLGGKYQLIRLLGEGGMGKVFEARHLQIGRRVAVKFLQAQYARRPDVAKRFENEARAAGGLEHENIAVVHDFGQASDESQYLVMELLNGQDCASLLEKEGPLPVPRAVDLVAQTCRGLVVAHRNGIVHRDLKPPNLFVSERADGSDLIKILDFGVAKLRFNHGGAPTAEGQPIGTAHYMAPEQARGERTVDERADVYAVGVILYELLSGRRPFEAPTTMLVLYRALHEQPPPLATLRPELPPALVAVVERAMAREPAQRFPTAQGLLEALAPFVQGASGMRVSQPALPLTAPMVGPPLLRDSTSPPLSRTTPEALVVTGSRAAPPPGRMLWVVAGAVLAATVAFSLLVLRSRAAPISEPVGTLAVPGVIAPHTPADSATAPLADVARVAAADASVIASASAPMAGVSKAIATPAKARAPSTSAPAVKAGPNCDPDYFFDAKGRRKFKPECF
jgi:eukaryotic-like serine/threonine-protein kinase